MKTSWGPATLITVLITTIAAIAGAVVVIVNPHTLTFPTYLQDLGIFLGALGLSSVGHGLLNSRTTPTNAAAVGTLTKLAEAVISHTTARPPDPVPVTPRPTPEQIPG